LTATQIDKWLPDYQVSATYSIFVHATARRTYDALAQASFSGLPIVRGLMRLRGYRLGKDQPKAPPAQASSGVRGSFLELETIPPQEVLLGIAGRFWRPDGGLIHGLNPSEFAEFRHAGYAKAVWNFSIAPERSGSRLSTETRVHTFGRAATVKFRLYWLAVGPFSGLIRKAMLREVKRLAEQTTA